jgi:hypothetical protein
MDYVTQEIIVKTVLKQEKKITRNYCLKRFISRLSAIIFVLKEKGWEFSTRRVYLDPNKKSWDFVYDVIKEGN